MLERVSYSVPSTSTGRIQSKSFYPAGDGSRAEFAPRVQRDLASGQLVPSGDLWPRFLYRGYSYDHQNPWEGLFRSALLVLVCAISLVPENAYRLTSLITQAFKHVFTSPSSALDGATPGKSTRSSNARIHGMKQVTAASIAYIATQVSRRDLPYE